MLKIILKEDDEMEKYNEYLISFIQKYKIKKTEIDVYQNLVNKLEGFPKYITEWNNYDLDKYITELDSISLNTITKYEQYIKNFYRFCCEIEGVTPKYLFLTRGNKYYVNYEKLFSTILTEPQYKMLKNVLSETVGGKEYNTRDKLLVELAWEGLSVDDIKNLKERDIEFKQTDGREVVNLKLETRDVIIYDEEIIEDIKKTMAQDEYYLVSKNADRKDQIRQLKDTEYLIRAIKTNSSTRSTAGNLSQILKKSLEKVYVLPDIDLDSITMESIRRSRAIDMFINNATLEDVKEFLGKKAECDLYWLQELGFKIKKKNLK